MMRRSFLGISLNVFRLGKGADCNDSAGNWCAADDRLDSGPIHDEAHPMLLSSAVAAKAMVTCAILAIAARCKNCRQLKSNASTNCTCNHSLSQKPCPSSVVVSLHLLRFVSMILYLSSVYVNSF